MSESFPPERQNATPAPNGAMHGEIVDYSTPIRAHSMTTVDGGAVTALVLSIMSWMMLPIVGAIAALMIAPGAKRRIRAANGALGTTAIATAAQIIASLNILLCLALAALIVAVAEALF